VASPAPCTIGTAQVLANPLSPSPDVSIIAGRSNGCASAHAAGLNHERRHRNKTSLSPTLLREVPQVITSS